MARGKEDKMIELVTIIGKNRANMRPEDAQCYERKLIAFIARAYPHIDTWEAILDWFKKLDLFIYSTDYFLPQTYIVRCGYSREKNSGDSCTYIVEITDEEFRASIKQIDSYNCPCGDYDLECGPMYNDCWEPAKLDYKENTFNDPDDMFVWIGETIGRMQEEFDKLEPWSL
jgi:hypothetical protein